MDKKGDMIQEKVMAESRAFMASRVILTATEIDFFTLLERKPSTAKELAERLGLDLKATTRLLDCLVVYGFLKKFEGRYVNTEKGAVLSADNPETVRPMVLHMDNLWAT